MGFSDNLSNIRSSVFESLGIDAQYRESGQSSDSNIDVTVIRTPIEVTTEDYENREGVLIAVRDSECTPSYSDIFTIDSFEYLVLSRQKSQYGMSYFTCVAKQEPSW